MSIKAHLITLGVIIGGVLFFGAAVMYPIQFAAITLGILAIVGVPLVYWYAYKWVNSYFGE